MERPLSLLFTIRRAGLRDLAAIEAIETASLPWAAHWTSESYLCPPGGERWAFVAESERGIAGFVLARWTGGEMEILNLAVDPAARGKGIGRALIRQAALEGVARGAVQVFLEVRESNSSARAFYARLCFAETGRRLDYYREPDEAAVLLARSLVFPAL